MDGLSCPSTTHCVAVGSSLTGDAVLTGSGTTWNQRTVPSGTDYWFTLQVTDLEGVKATQKLSITIASRQAGVDRHDVAALGEGRCRLQRHRQGERRGPAVRLEVI